MKKLFLFITALLFVACSKSDDNTSPPVNEIDKLPLATQIGANTVGCDSDDNSLPEETQEGKKTIGFRVNGNVFKGRSFTTYPFARYPREKRFELYRDGYVDSLGSDFSLIVRINNPIEEGGTYLLSSTDSLFKGNYGSISYAIGKKIKLVDNGILRRWIWGS